MRINQTYLNGFMTVELISLVTTDLQNLSNIAIVRRLNNDKQTIDFVVVNGFKTDCNKCTWAFAYQYDIPNLEEATEILISKL